MYKDKIYWTDKNGHKRFRFEGTSINGFVNPEDWTNMFITKLITNKT